MKAWNSNEEKLLRLIYPVATWKKLLREFHGRSQESIRWKARKLGLSKRPNRWVSIVEFHAPVFKFPHRVPNNKKDKAEAA